MKLHKFLSRKSIQLHSDEITLCIEKVTPLGLEFQQREDVLSFDVFSKKVSIPFEGVHTFWGTAYKPFKGTAKRIVLYVSNSSGIIEGTDEVRTQYTANLKIYGTFRYKYAREKCENEVMRCIYDYDTDLSILLDRAVKAAQNFNL